MNIANKHLDNLHTLTWQDFTKPFLLQQPFKLELADGEFFFAEQVIRSVPKRRLVVFGTWRDKPVIAKLFFKKKAKQRIKKDVNGIKILQQNRIPTPALYFQGESKDQHIQVLLLQRIFNAKELTEIWKERTTTKQLLPLLKAIVVELATQHVLGVLQHDLHLGNFMLTKKTMFMIDGAAVEFFPYILPKKQSVDNLALFISQLGVGIEKYQALLFHHYAKSRGWIVKDVDVLEFRTLVKKWNVLRWEKFEKKIFRQSTQFACLRTSNSQGMYDRNFAGPQFLAFLQNPEPVFHQPEIQCLKAGRSATVIKVSFDNREFVIKRYNLKNIWHYLRRCMRRTRSAESWRLGQKLDLFGVHTAKPAAFIEKRFLGLRGKSYYVSEYVEGTHAGNYFAEHQQDESKTKTMVNRITTLLKNIAKLEISHGDLKITNILVNAREQPVLIDLDGSEEHMSLSSLRRAWRKEIQRFLRNFETQPEVEEKFKEKLYARDTQY